MVMRSQGGRSCAARPVPPWFSGRQDEPRSLLLDDAPLPRYADSIKKVSRRSLRPNRNPVPQPPHPHEPVFHKHGRGQQSNDGRLGHGPPNSTPSSEPPGSVLVAD